MSRRGASRDGSARDGGPSYAALAGTLPQLSYRRTSLLADDSPGAGPPKAKGVARLVKTLPSSLADAPPAWQSDDRALYRQSDAALALRVEVAEPLRTVRSPTIGRMLSGAPSPAAFPAAPTFWSAQRGSPAASPPLAKAARRGGRASPARSPARIPAPRTAGAPRGAGGDADDEGEGGDDPRGERLLAELRARLAELRAAAAAAAAVATAAEAGGECGEAGVLGLGSSPAEGGGGVGVGAVSPRALSGALKAAAAAAAAPHASTAGAEGAAPAPAPAVSARRALEEEDALWCEAAERAAALVAERAQMPACAQAPRPPAPWRRPARGWPRAVPNESRY